MRVLVACLVVAFAVLLALPESAGAPACGCGKKVGGDVISESVQQESSISTEKRKETEQEASDTQCRCSNGLVSGSKKISLSQQVSEKEEEQRRLAAERNTTTGSQKILESEKKKKEVTEAQKKSLVVYYLVSYKRLPSQRNHEARDAYYRRVFPKEKNIHVFYHKIFKAYEKETPQAYIDRIEFIFTNVYPELDCRLDVKWLDQFDHYYTLKYSRKADESDESYFPRVLKKGCGETKEQYKKRMECLVAALDEEDFTHITFDDSDQGYKIGVRKTPAKSRSSPNSTGIRIGQVNESSKKSRSDQVEVDKNESSVEQTNKQGSSAEYQSSLKKKRKLVEKEENKRAYAYRVAYTALPKKNAGESDYDYYLRFFGTYNANWTEDKRNELYLRILIQYKGESVAHYVERIDFLFDKVYPQLDIRTNSLVVNLLDHYYREKYARLAKETEEQWFTRVLTKRAGESPANYKKRVGCLQTILTDVKWGRVAIDENSDAGYRLITVGNKVRSRVVGGARIRRGGVKVKWVNLGSLVGRPTRNYGETDIDFYLRIFRFGRSRKTFYAKVFQPFKDESQIEYVNRINFIFTRVYPKLDCRFNRKYAGYLDKYYIAQYGQRDDESDEDWFTRVLKRTNESDDEYLAKVENLKQFFADEDWSKVKIDVKSKNGFILLSSDNGGSSTRSVDDDADSSDTITEAEIKKYFAKLENEDTNAYYNRFISRLSLRKRFLKNYVLSLTSLRRYYPGLAIWYSPRYINILKDYYSNLYARRSGESDDQYFLRIVTKEDFETEEQCAQRTEIVRELMPNLSLWYNAKYFGLVGKVYRLVFKKLSTEDETTYFNRLIARTPEETDVVYVNRLGLVKQTLITLPLWYSKQYLDLIKNFYIARYTKVSSESDEALFQRIITKEPGETDQLCYQRVGLVRQIFPNLALWYNPKYYVLTRNFYQTQYQKLDSEDNITYFKRITVRLPDESDTVYVNRLFLVKRTLVRLPLWYSTQYLDLIRNYYVTLYTKSSSESDESLFKRIVTKEDDETDEDCVKRVSVVRQLFPSLALWHDTKYYGLTKNFYQNLYKKSTSEDESTYFQRITSRLTGESSSVYIRRLSLIKKQFVTLPLWYSQKYLDFIKNFYVGLYTKTSSESDESLYKRIITKEDDETNEQCVQRVSLVWRLNPNLPLWYDAKYFGLTKQFYSNLYQKSSDENEVTYFRRIVTKLPEESDVVYIKRVSLLRNVFGGLRLWYSRDCLDLVKEYYLARYTRESSESEESQYSRIVTKEAGESDEQCAQRVQVVRFLLPNLSLWYNQKYYDLIKNFYQIWYKKLSSEDDSVYFKRIVTKSSDETDDVYVNRLAAIKRSLSGLKLWYSKDFLYVTKNYYIARYTRASSETDQSLYQRIITKESGENDDQWVKRVDIVHDLYPNLALWSDVKYYDLVKNWYQAVYKKFTSEDEITYFKRLTTRTVQETDAVYLGRLSLIERTFTGLSLWSSVENLNIIKSYYLLKYTKQAGETDDAYFARLVAKESCDVSDQVYVRRLYIVQLLTSSSALWYDAKFYDKFTKTFYSLYYSKLDGESCDGWLTRAITLLPGETNENAIRRVTLIKQATGSCGCWTLDALSKVQAAKTFSSEYIGKIRSTFFPISYTKTASSSASATKAANSEENEVSVVITRGAC